MMSRAVLDRRILLTTGLGALGSVFTLTPASAKPTALPSGGQLQFKVYRKGALLGEHAMTFTREAGQLVVQTHVDLLAKLGPVPLLHYQHEATERWTGDRFDSLQTTTTSNGKTQAVQAHRIDGGGLTIQPAEGAAYTARDGVLPLTHWNRQMMDAALFNPQDGKMLREQATARGAEAVQLADGRTVAATRYSLYGDSQIDDWYDSTGVWTALRGKIKDGSTLDYRRV
jgi:hypothetical protein